MNTFKQINLASSAFLFSKTLSNKGAIKSICFVKNKLSGVLLKAVLDFMKVSTFFVEDPNDRLSAYKHISIIDEIRKEINKSYFNICVILEKNNGRNKVITNQCFKNSKLKLSKKDSITHDFILSFLEEHCYENIEMPCNPGEYYVSGGTIHIITINNEIIIDFLGNNIENIKLNGVSVEEVTIYSFRSDLDFSGDIFEHVNNPETLYFDDDCFLDSSQKHDQCKEIPRFFLNPTKNPIGLFADFLHKNLTKKDGNSENLRQVIISVESEGMRNRLIQSLKFFQIYADSVNNIDELRTIGVAILPIYTGFMHDSLIVVSWNDLFGSNKKNKKTKKKFGKNKEEITQNDLIIHIDHGLGRFLEVKTIKIENIIFDCLNIEYHGGDKLLVPVENISDVSKYSSCNDKVALDRLGNNSWKLRMSNAKEKIQALADELMKVAAIRKASPGIKFINNDLRSIFILPKYRLTSDQLSAINDVENDLSSGEVMDRIICGDTGYGKTEIALRAAAKVCIDGYQVAILVPTKLLCNQHFNTFNSRFINTAICKISGDKSNLVSLKKNIQDGKFDIIIGTHSILNLSFAKLGLVIIDEEHNFGVKQKEKLKHMSHNVHMLSMSATPIPRTLQMSITKIREISIINTPPTDRKNIRTSVMEFEECKIKDAIKSEINRNGTIFCVVPRIKDIDSMIEILMRLLPNVKIQTAHGKKKSDEMNKTIKDFYDKKFDILVSTTIIESGLDFPDANTIIVFNADMLGLSQLYQLRGRVGRSDKSSFAIFVTSKNLNSDESYSKRLNLMKSLRGSIDISMQDMDMRGFGNLIGDKQSGQIKEVGVDLYRQMLQDAIDARPYVEKDVNVELSISRGIPLSYIDDFKSRMIVYKKLGECSDVYTLDEISSDLIENFGDLPNEVVGLLKITELKILCRKCCIISAILDQRKLCFKFHDLIVLDPDQLISNLHDIGVKYRMSQDNGIVVLEKNENNNMVLECAINFVSLLSQSELNFCNKKQ